MAIIKKDSISYIFLFLFLFLFFETYSFSYRKKNVPIPENTYQVCCKKIWLYTSPNEDSRSYFFLNQGKLVTLLSDKKIKVKEKNFMKVSYENKTYFIEQEYLIKFKKNNSEKDNNGNYIIGKEIIDDNNPIPFDYVPSDLVLIPRKYLAPSFTSKHFMLRREARYTLIKMLNKAKREKIKLGIIAAYRSSQYQGMLYKFRVALNPKNHHIHPPGYSEHQLGTSVDIAFSSYLKKESFSNLKMQDLKEYRWLKKNSKDFGYISHSKHEKEKGIHFFSDTGPTLHAWHFRYVKKK